MTVTPTNTELQTNLLATLRQSIPERQLGEKEALRIAEQQAECLRKLFDVHKPRFPHEALMDIPKIEVDFSREMPVSGSTIWNGENWLILINAYDNPWRQRFTLAHEFKHIIDHPHRKRMYRGRTGCHPHQQSERAADHFAGCLLMPEIQLEHLYLQGVQRLTELSQHFQVSPRAIQFRLKQIGLTGKRCGPGIADKGNMGYNRGAMTRTSA
jgi:Zn-dependent peptidase ImmA (M78 family)